MLMGCRMPLNLQAFLCTIIYTSHENFSYVYGRHYFKGAVVTVTFHELFPLNCFHVSVIQTRFSQHFLIFVFFSLSFSLKVYLISIISFYSLMHFRGFMLKNTPTQVQCHFPVFESPCLTLLFCQESSHMTYTGISLFVMSSVL